MPSRRQILTALVALPALFVTLPTGTRAQVANISGVYQAQGRNPDGSSYAGTVTVQEGAQGNVAFSWAVAGRSYSGTGQRSGSVVTVNWGGSAPAVYVVMSDGALHGTWANGYGLERLAR